MTAEQLLAAAERLADAWIEEERQRRKVLEKVRRAGGSATSLSQATEQLKQCRRELQVALGLVVQSDDLEDRL